MEVIITVTQATVCVLPEGYRHRDLWEITVERTGVSPDRWAVRRSSLCLSTTGEWDGEPLPSSRTDEWLATHRFDWRGALEAATKAAPNVTVNGRCAADLAAEPTA